MLFAKAGLEQRKPPIGQTKCRLIQFTQSNTEYKVLLPTHINCGWLTRFKWKLVGQLASVSDTFLKAETQGEICATFLI